MYMEKVRSQFLSLRHLLLKYKANSSISIVAPRLLYGRDRVWKSSVIFSEMRSRAELKRACFRFCTFHTNEIPRADPLVQVEYVRVVDLDIGTSKSDICAVRVVAIPERAAEER